MRCLGKLLFLGRLGHPICEWCYDWHNRYVMPQRVQSTALALKAGRLLPKLPFFGPMLYCGIFAVYVGAMTSVLAPRWRCSLSAINKTTADTKNNQTSRSTKQNKQHKQIDKNKTKRGTQQATHSTTTTKRNNTKSLKQL